MGEARIPERKRLDSLGLPLPANRIRLHQSPTQSEDRQRAGSEGLHQVSSCLTGLTRSLTGPAGWPSPRSHFLSFLLHLSSFPGPWLEGQFLDQKKSILRRYHLKTLIRSALNVHGTWGKNPTKTYKRKTSTYLEVIIHANKLLNETCSIILPDKCTFKGKLDARHRNAAVQGGPAPSPQPTPSHS